ncbi:hypothetical protein FRB99_008373 [Tulasnella sp. 403]|nr:hypothetical protein FRB99_008373 [Tulasnella sp. 403]
MAISLVRELTVWASLFHENIIPLIGFHLNDGLDQAWLVSPYMANGSILDYIKRIRANEDLRILLVLHALDTAKGLHYLHNINPPVCHGDIKALNVLITDEPRAVLCDFGLAKTMEEMPSGLTTSTFNQAGSLPYESPELVHGTSQRSRETDVWAWGCLLQEIFTERCPYYWANNPGAIIGWIAKDIPPATLSEIACPGYRLVNGSGMGILRRADIIFDEKDKIGSGSFGITYRAQLVDGVTAARTKVVVKKLFVPSDPLVFQKLQTDIRVAVEQQLSFTHPNVLKLIGYYSPSPNPSQEVLLVSSQLLGRSLIDYLKSRNYSQKLALGNIIVGLDGRAVLSDCPLADLAPYDHAGGNTPATEIKRYQSPERLANTAIRGVYDDTWSWGCVFLEVAHAPGADGLFDN